MPVLWKGELNAVGKIMRGLVWQSVASALWLCHLGAIYSSRIAEMKVDLSHDLALELCSISVPGLRLFDLSMDLFSRDIADIN